MFLLLSTEWCYLMGVPVSFVSTWIQEIWMWPDTTITYLSGLVVVPHPQIYDHHTHISPWRVVGLFVKHPHTHDPHTERYSEKPTYIRLSSSWDTLRDLNMHRVFRFDIFLKVPNWRRHNQAGSVQHVLLNLFHKYQYVLNCVLLSSAHSYCINCIWFVNLTKIRKKRKKKSLLGILLYLLPTNISYKNMFLSMHIFNFQLTINPNYC